MEVNSQGLAYENHFATADREHLAKSKFIQLSVKSYLLVDQLDSILQCISFLFLQIFYQSQNPSLPYPRKSLPDQYLPTPPHLLGKVCKYRWLRNTSICSDCSQSLLDLYDIQLKFERMVVINLARSVSAAELNIAQSVMDKILLQRRTFLKKELVLN